MALNSKSAYRRENKLYLLEDGKEFDSARSLGTFLHFVRKKFEPPRYPGLPRDLLISRVTLRFVSSQFPLRMNAPEALFASEQRPDLL